MLLWFAQRLVPLQVGCHGPIPESQCFDEFSLDSPHGLRRGLRLRSLIGVFCTFWNFALGVSRCCSSCHNIAPAPLQRLVVFPSFAELAEFRSPLSKFERSICFENLIL